ncbi:hypothetical protein [Micromonospora sediminicola]|uniref:hypothetical protein n=1 Tax=Micromonospora sediminicola TaxID=946078 RepID=UPI0037ADD86E
MTIDAKTVAADIMTGNARDVTTTEVWAHIGQAYDTTGIDASFADEVVDLIGKAGIDLIWPDDTSNTELAAARAEIAGLKAANTRLLDRCYAAIPVITAVEAWADAHSDRDVQLFRRPGAPVPALAALYDAFEEYRVVYAALDAGQVVQPDTAGSWSLPVEPDGVERLRDRRGRLWVRARYTNGPDLWWQGKPGNGLPILWMELLADGPLTEATAEQVTA